MRPQYSPPNKRAVRQLKKVLHRSTVVRIVRLLAAQAAAGRQLQVIDFPKKIS